jgi:peptidoglycan/xylan/chitin deacetylase (PgdA/CDA1 family)
MRAIITFHSIDSGGSVLSYPPEAFADFLGFLARTSFPVCDLDTLLHPDTRQGIALTFDDGMESVFSQALPVLRDFGFKAHLFLTPGMVGGSNKQPTTPSPPAAFQMLRWSQIEACHAGGIRIEAHTVNHPDLRDLDNPAVERECARADEIIATRLGRRPAYFAYPFGHNNARLRGLLRDRYKASVTTELRPLRDREDSAALPRLDSYYLKSPWSYRRLGLGHPCVRTYLALRSALRSLRGTQ